MSQVRWSRRPALAAAPALAVLAVAGCSLGGSASPHASSPVSNHVTSTPKATSYTATQLRGALLTKINGQSAAAPVESGAYGSLAEVKAARNSMDGVTVKPAECAQITVTGFNSPSLAKVPATVSTFRAGNNDVSEVLLAPSAAAAADAMRNPVPPGCARYTATVKDKTFVYAISEQSVRDLGQAARAMNIKATGAESINMWSVVYRASDFVGAVTIVGPNASVNVATTLAAQACAHAAKILH